MLGNLPSDRQLWESIQNQDLPWMFRAFLWKAMHGVHKLGRFWENIPNFEHRVNCRDCGEEDSLKHIMLWCLELGHGSVWPLAKAVWVLRFNLVRVEIRELRPEVVAESDEVLVHYQSRTNV